MRQFHHSAVLSNAHQATRIDPGEDSYRFVMGIACIAAKQTR
jgi:hypothetical protein